MDPASAIVGFVTTGIQVVKLVRKTIEDIKNAPKELKLLQDRAANIEACLEELQQRQLDGLFESERDTETLERTAKRAKTCLDEISAFTAKIQKTNKGGETEVDRFKWVIKGDKAKGLSEQLNTLDALLITVMNLVNSRSHSRLERSQIRQEETLTIICTNVSRSANAIEDIRSRQLVGRSLGRKPPTILNSRAYLTPSTKLSCPSDCACRCHSPLSKPVVPQALVPFVGQFFVSKQILHAIGASSWECNVQTCRRDRLTSHRLTWVARWWYMTISISSNSFTTLLHAPRVVPVYAPIWELINDGEVDALQALLVAGGASLYDVAEDGETVFQFAVRIWARNRSEDAVKVIRFLKDAGADPDFIVDQRFSVIDTVFDASLATLIEHPTSNFLHAVRTSTVAVDICRSILDMDVVDVFEDYLSDAHPKAAQMLFRQPSEGEAENSTVDAEAIIRACGYDSMLMYSIWNMREDAALRLIQSGTRIPEEALPIAVGWGRINLAKSLLAAGADVNGRDYWGYTALYYACCHLCITRLELLVEFAGEDIDWNARTPEGENALQIAKRMQLVIPRPPWALERIFDILHAHIPDVDDEEGLEDWEGTSYAIPGAFPASGSS